jgi:biotin carboxyl carrier protein
VGLDSAALLGAEELLEYAAIASPNAAEAEAEAVKALDIRSTLVGFYRAVARRGAKPLAPGDSVKEGQIIGAVEALNVLNEVESPAAGRVRKILVDDGQPVQYGQVLMMVEPLKA